MPARRRKLWLAGVLSLYVPGLGQVYNGQARNDSQRRLSAQTSAEPQGGARFTDAG